MALTYTYQTEYATRSGGIKTGLTHTLQIIDTIGGISGTFCCTDEGVIFRQEGKSRDMWQDIQPASVTFTMIIENQNHIAFIDALKQFQENRFIVKYQAGPTAMFTGVLLVDEVVTRFGNNITSEGVTDHPHGRYTLTAVDGISLLKEVAYAQDNGVFYTDRSPVPELIGRALEKMPTAGNGQRMAFAVNWSPDVGSFPDNTAMDPNIFLHETRNGGFIPWSCWDVIKEICKNFDMRCIYLANLYVFEQINSRAGAQQNFQIFNFDGSASGSIPFNAGGHPVDCDNLWRLAEDIRAYKPPLRTTTVLYESNFSHNLLVGNKWQNQNQSATFNTCFTQLGPVPVPNSETRLTFRGNIEFIPYGHPFTGQIRIIFYFRIKVGTQYFVRELSTAVGEFNNTGAYQPEAWQGTAGEYAMSHLDIILLPDHQANKRYHPFYITTLPLPISLDGEFLEICFRHQAYDNANNPINVTNMNVEAWLDDGDIKVIDQENNIVEKTTISTTVLNSSNNSKNITRTAIASTGPTYGITRLTDDSSPFNDQINWTAPNVGSGVPHYELLARSMMARGMQTQEFMEGAVCGLPIVANFAPITYDGKTWIFVRGEYVSGKETWAGEWMELKIGNAAALTTIEEEVFDDTPGPNGFTVSGGAGLFPVCTILTGIQKNIDVDAINFPVPDTTGWTNEQIAARLEVYKQGIWQRYVSPNPTRVDEFEWDNTNREIILGEQTRTGDWTKLRVWI